MIQHGSYHQFYGSHHSFAREISEELRRISAREISEDSGESLHENLWRITEPRSENSTRLEELSLSLYPPSEPKKRRWISGEPLTEIHALKNLAATLLRTSSTWGHSEPYQKEQPYRICNQELLLTINASHPCSVTLKNRPFRRSTPTACTSLSTLLRLLRNNQLRIPSIQEVSSILNSSDPSLES